MQRRLPTPSPAPTTRGAASLVVVMVLFFIITLVAAYTARNLLFEQRTSTNQYRSTLAFEAADAGVEWALARLNDARMNDNCTPVASAGAAAGRPSFRERYLNIDAATGIITPLNTDGTLATTLLPEGDRLAGCIFNGLDNWVCDCPATGTPNPTVTYTGNGPFAAFWVRFVSVTPVATGVTGVVRIQVNACTRADSTCLDFARQAQPGDGLATVWAMVNLRSALVSSPAAALTVRGAFSRTAGSPTITNADPASGGLTVNAGCPTAPPCGIATTGLVLNTIPGTPPQLSIFPDDPALIFPTLTLTPATPANDPSNLMFNSVFGMWPDTYLGPPGPPWPALGQPGLVEVDCASGCTAAQVNDQILLNPGHAIHVRGAGPLRIETNIPPTATNPPLAPAPNPALIIADGNVEFQSGAPIVNGLIYSRAATWQLRGNGTVRGAAVAQQDFDFNNNDPTIIYDRDVMRRVRNQNGSFVKVPGGWRDFQP